MLLPVTDSYYTTRVRILACTCNAHADGRAPSVAYIGDGAGRRDAVTRAIARAVRPRATPQPAPPSSAFAEEPGLGLGDRSAALPNPSTPKRDAQHGRRGEGMGWAHPRLVCKNSEIARKGYRSMQRHEYLDKPRWVKLHTHTRTSARRA